MADTRQIVRWCLEFQCPLRQGDASKDPAKALEVVRRAKSYWESLKTGPKDSGVFGNIFVTGWTFAERADKFKKPLRCSYPSDGYLIAEEFGSYGGSEGLRSMCANCPANTSPEGVAGCAGTLLQQDEAMATVVAAEAAEQARLAKIQLQRQRFRKQERYILTELGEDLTVRTPASENDFEDEPPPMFNEIDFSLLISRAVSKGIPITSMHHWSISGDFDKYTMKIEDPKVVLREWLQLGCHELFHATFKIPDSILDTFENPKGRESST